MNEATGLMGYIVAIESDNKVVLFDYWQKIKLKNLPILAGGERLD